MSGKRERPSAQPMSPAERGVWVGLFLMGAGLLALRHESYVFTMDTAELSEMGRRIASGRAFPLAGTQVASGEAGRWLGPLAYYLCALPFVFSADAVAAIMFTAGLWLLSGWLLFGAVQVLFDRKVAFAAVALFFAGAHAHIEHRLNFFSVLAVVSVLLIVRACVAWGPGGRARASGWVVAAVGVALQLHVVHLAFVGIVLVTALVYRPRVDKRAVWLGLMVPLALQLPWVVEQVRTDGQDMAEMLSWLARRGEGEALSASTASPLRTLLAAAWAPFRVPLDVARQQGDAPSWFAHVSLAALLVATASGVLLAPRVGRWRRGGAILLVWIALPLALMVLGANGVFSFHLVPVLPALAIVAALGLRRLSRAAGRAETAVFGGVVAAIVAGQIQLLNQIYAGVAVHGEMRLPMTMVLSYPDALYRFPTRAMFPSLGTLRGLESALDARSLPVDVSGRVHGSDAMAFSFMPPFLPAQDGSTDRPPPLAGAAHFALHRGDRCVGGAPVCAEPVEAAFYEGWTVDHEGERRRIGFPLAARRDHVYTRRLEAGERVVRVITMGPTPHGMDRLAAPEVELRLDGELVSPTALEVSDPFWIRAERHYRLRNPAPATLSIESRAGGRVMLDLAVSP